MHQSSVLALVFFGSLAAAGCTAQVDSSGSPERTSESAEKLTVSQCATQQQTCLANNPFFGLFVCPAQYAKCTLTASNGLPAQINQAISDAAQCNSANLACLNAANTPAATLACGVTNAQCVAGVLQVGLPSIVTGTAACVENAVSCIGSAEVPADLTACANKFQSCAVTQIQMVVPPQVGQLIGNVSACDTTLNSCIAAAATPIDLTVCGEAGASCVAGTLGISIPKDPVTAVIDCAQTAATCTLQAVNDEQVAGCQDTLTMCVAAAVTPSTTPPPMTCEQKWTACLQQTPLKFLNCDLQLLACKN